MDADTMTEEKPREMPKKVRLSMWITGRQHAELKELASYEGRTVSDIIRQLVSIYLRDVPANGNEERGF